MPGALPHHCERYARRQRVVEPRPADAGEIPAPVPQVQGIDDGPRQRREKRVARARLARDEGKVRRGVT